LASGNIDLNGSADENARKLETRPNFEETVISRTSGARGDGPLAPRLQPGEADQSQHLAQHLVQFYEKDSFLLETVGRWISEGLEAGESSVVVGTEAHRRGFERYFKAKGLDPRRLSEQGRYVALDAGELLSKFAIDGRLDETRFSYVVGTNVARATKASKNGQVRGFGEMVALMWLEGNREGAARLEEMWNRFLKERSISLCCAYPLDAFRGEPDEGLFLKVCAEHSRVIPAESYTALATPEERDRTVTLLQHKAKELEAESAGRKRAENSLQLRQKELVDFIENAVEGVHQLGPDGRVLWANSAQLRLLGYSAEEYVGHYLREFYVEAGRFDGFWQKLMAHETVYDLAADLRCRDGSIKHVLIHSGGHWDGANFLYTRCFIRDVTERVQLEQELEKTIARLAEADRRKDEFLALLGHELRNPLGAVQNAIATACLDESRRSGMLEIARRQTEHLGRLVDDLLDVSRITQGKISLQKQPLYIGPSVQCAVEQARSLIESRKQALVLSLAPETQTAQIDADAARFQQIIGNLLHNAAKFTQSGGRIEVAAEVRSQQAVIRVSDNGPGISPELMPRVFDLFAQADTSLARVHGGLGIGLTLVKQLVEMHGGRVRAGSEGLGQGSEFEVLLPLTTQGLSHADAAEKSEASKGSRVLVVEDNADAAESLMMVLQLSGHQVTVAGNGQEALKVLGADDFDVALIDIGLPDIDGYEVARRIRALPKSKITVLAALTGYGQQRDRQMALSAGFDRHFMKPVDIGQLREFLTRLNQ